MKYKIFNIILIVLGIIIFIICMYNIYQYQLTVEIPSDIDDTKYEVFYRIGYMQNEGNKFLFPITLFVPAILLGIGTMGLVGVNYEKC